MSYQVEKISGNQVKISFELSASAFDEAMQKAYLKNRSRINVPGFRRGKAPKKLIENMYGESIFYDDAIDILFPDAYDEAVTTEKLEVVDKPVMDEMEQIGSGKDCKFTIKVYVKPDVELGNYQGLKATLYRHTVTEDEIKARIDQDVERSSTMEDVTDRPLEKDDTANLDYAGTVDGVPFEGGTAQNQTLLIGSNSFIPGFEDQMIGMNIGEEKDLSLTFPEQYHAQDLAGKAAVFHVKLNGIQKKVAPELDDEFAADVSEFSTFDEYKADIVKKLQDAADKNAQTELENDLVQQAVDGADCDIPDAMVEAELDTMMREMNYRMMMQGLRFEDYLKFTGQTAEAVREMYKSEARNRVKSQLVLEAIAKKENIEATDADVEEAIVSQAEAMSRDVQEFKNTLTDTQKEYLKENAEIKKTIDFLKASASVEEKDESERISAQEALRAAEQTVEALEDGAEENAEKKKKTTRKRSVKKETEDTVKSEETSADESAEEKPKKKTAAKKTASSAKKEADQSTEAAPKKTTRKTTKKKTEEE